MVTRLDASSKNCTDSAAKEERYTILSAILLDDDSYTFKAGKTNVLN